jgi:hypothetical protein
MRTTLRKLLICPYFGELPPWFDTFMANAEGLSEHGYTLLIDHDEDAFQGRVSELLDVTCPPLYGTGKIWDFRPALGLLYEKEAKGYDFWGHIDFDVVLGNVQKWVTDEFLDGLDMHSNHRVYVNGCWSLYRNNDLMRHFFMEVPTWRRLMENPEPNGWIELEYSDRMMIAGGEERLRYRWTGWQVYTDEDLREVRWQGDRLMCRDEEIMLAHFRRTKVYPKGCLA